MFIAHMPHRMVRIVMVALFALAIVLFVGLPAFAQTDPVPIDQSPVTAIAMVTAAVKLIVDKLRKYVPKIDGELVNLVAFGLALAATYVPEVLIDPPDSWVDRVYVAVGVAGLSAVFAQFAPSHEVEAAQPRGV